MSEKMFRQRILSKSGRIMCAKSTKVAYIEHDAEILFLKIYSNFDGFWTVLKIIKKTPNYVHNIILPIPHIKEFLLVINLNLT